MSAPFTTAIIGAGLMGHGIAQAVLMAGLPVAIWDPDPAALAAVPARIAAHAAHLGLRIDGAARLARDLADCVTGADLVIEAAPEKLSLKQDLMVHIATANPAALVASNTSVLRITEIAAKAPDPSKIVGAHWWNPPYLIPIVEIVHGVATSPATAAQVTYWIARMGKTPVQVRQDVPGFIGNRMQFALMREAAHIVATGIATAEDVDLVARQTFGARLAAVGPLTNADFIGLDLAATIMAYLAPDLAVEAEVPALFRAKIDAGARGAKDGLGIYPWPAGARDAVEERLLSHLAAQFLTQNETGDEPRPR